MFQPLTPSQSQNFAYDDADRLTSWNEGGAATTQSWTLSPVGDWTSTVRNGVVENRTHTNGKTQDSHLLEELPRRNSAKLRTVISWKSCPYPPPPIASTPLNISGVPC